MSSAFPRIGAPCGHWLPKQVLYQAELCPDANDFMWLGV
jgi:hypothetical protein